MSANYASVCNLKIFLGLYCNRNVRNQFYDRSYAFVKFILLTELLCVKYLYDIDGNFYVFISVFEFL